MRRLSLFSVFLFMIMAVSTDTRAQSIDDVVSVEIAATRDKVYVNEPFQLILSITSTGIRIEPNPQLLPSSMSEKTKLACGNFDHELPPERSLQGNQLRENRRFIANARAVSPQTLEIHPVMRIGVLSGFGLFTQISQFDIKAKTLSLPVLPLPDTGKPAGFSGAVGDFSLDVEAVPADVAAGDLITVVTRISGSGYLESVPVMNISPGPNFKAYPARKIQDLERGGKVFEQVLVPQNTNAVSIPRVSFCFFNPSNGTYKTVSKGPFQITFHPPVKASTEAIYRPVETKALAGRSILQDKLAAMQDSFNLKIILISAYWLIIIGLSLWVTAKRARGSLPAIGIILLAAILFVPLRNIAGRYLSPGNEAALIRNEKARLAPAYTAITSFDLSRDSQVRVLETYGSWSKIETSGRKGWIPSDAVTNSAVEN